MTTSRLYKSNANRMLFGVCGGLAEYFSVDPVLVRVAFVFLALASGGLGLLLYIVLAIVMPREEHRPSSAQWRGFEEGSSRHPEGEVVEGEVVGARPETASPDAGPAGEDGEVRQRREAEGTRRRNGLAFLLIAIGALLLLANLNVFWWLHWGTFWPVVLILVGVAIILGWSRRR